MENRADFRLGKRIFLGILGNLGSKIDPRDLSKKARASGLNGHGKRGETQEKRGELSKFPGDPRITIHSGAEPPRYAGRTRVRSAYWGVIAYVLRMGGHRGVGATWPNRGLPPSYAGRNSDQAGDSPFG